MRGFGSAICVALPIMMCLGCSYIGPSSVKITNTSDHDMEDVRVVFSDTVTSADRIAEGTSRKFNATPRMDGELSISYSLNGEITEKKYYYLTPGLNIFCEFQVHNDDIVGDCD
ncbi:hypothetical protein [Brevundimonas faecalis]|uniref:Lipoprotein n=1 Tax=Brevundimonas faecalis TaxID=947378 RepID=A0ABV2R882_9CAUL